MKAIVSYNEFNVSKARNLYYGISYGKFKLFYMEKKSPPKKPITPFFLFRQKLKEDGKKCGGKAAGDAWKELDEKEKAVFENEYKTAKEKYDKYLEEVEGIAPKSSSKKNEKPTCFNASRIRAVCGKKKEIKEMSGQTSKALGRVLERFMRDLGKSSSDEMKATDKKTVTVEVLLAAIDTSKKCAFLKSMEDFDKIVKEAEDAAESEKEKAKKARSKKKEEKEGKDDEEESDEDKKKKEKKSKKGKC
jgi:hypothetical protein